MYGVDTYFNSLQNEKYVKIYGGGSRYAGNSGGWNLACLPPL